MSIVYRIKRRILLQRYGSNQLFRRFFSDHDLDETLERTPFTVIDTEGTSANPRKARLLSIGGVRIENMAIDLSQVFNRLLKVEGDFRRSVHVHGITPSDLEKFGRPPSAVIEEFLEFAKGSIIVGFNVTYDVKLIEKYTKNEYGIPLPFPRIDVLTLLKRTHIKPSSLEETARQMGIPVKAVHSALDDAYTTALIFLKILYPMKTLPLKHLHLVI